jgi:hypothetical protein
LRSGLGHGLVSRFLTLSKSVNDDRREVQAAKLKIHLVETASASEARFFACYRAASGTIHISAHRGVRSADLTPNGSLGIGSVLVRETVGLIKMNDRRR